MFCKQKQKFVISLVFELTFNPFPNDKFWTLPNWKSLQTTIQNLTKIAECSPKQKKTLWQKEKLLVMSNFSFSHSVFKRLRLQTRKNQELCGKGLTRSEKTCSTTSPTLSWYSCGYCSMR